MKCNLCKEDLGNGDEYDLLKSHMYYCDSKEGMAVMKARDEDCGRDYCNCCQ